MLEQLILPVPPSASLSKERKFSHLPEELTTSSIQFNSFQSPTKNTGQREFKNFVLFAIFFIPCMYTRVCWIL